MREHGYTFVTVVIAAALGTLLANWATNNIQSLRELTTY